MDDQQIAEQIEPMCKEYFDSYLVIGFRADDHKLCVAGDLGRPDKLPQLNRKMQPVYELAKQMMENEENKKGLAGF